MKTIFSFFGPPGSGKGTLAELAVKRLHFNMISTGSLCRRHIAEKTEFGEMLNSYISKGDLVPDGLITKMLIEELNKYLNQDNPVILDGYPRTKEQAELFYKFLRVDLADYRFRVILIKLSEDEIIKRISGRLVCQDENCQNVYHISMFSKKDTVGCRRCGSKLVTRDDDRKDVVIARLKNYNEYSSKILDYYKSIGQKVEVLDIDGLSIEQVFEKFRSIL